MSVQCRAAIRGPRCLLAALLLCLPLPAPAQSSRPFPGVIALNVDATDVQRRIFRVVETIPAGAGRFELYYPQWLPGNHAPRGPIEQMAGLRFRVDGRELNWLRDPVNVYHFSLNLPAGTRQLQVEFQVASPQNAEQGRSGTSCCCTRPGTARATSACRPRCSCPPAGNTPPR
jgi:Peptidase M61 N-terminal domain